MTRARWQWWATSGLLIALMFLAHDVGMASAAPHGKLLVRPQAAAPSHLPVLHIARDTGASHRLRSHHQCTPPEAPPQSQCEISRAAVRTAANTLDATLQAVPAAIRPVAGGHDVVIPPWGVDASVLSARDWRTLLQVFLI